MSDNLQEARTLLDQQKFSEALELLHKVESVSPIVKVSLARAMSGLGKWEPAHNLLCEALTEDPNNHEGYASRGLLYFLSKNFQKAHADYQKAIEGAPLNGRYHGLQGVLLAQIGDIPSALNALESAYELGSHDPAYLLVRAQIYLATRDLDKAAEMLELADKHEGDQASIAALEGAMNMLAGKHDEALASYRFAVEKEPSAIPNWMNMLSLTAKLDRSRLLEQSLSGLKIHPDSDEIIQVAVGAYLEQGKAKEALQLLANALQRRPKNPLLHFQMGMGLVTGEQFKEAIEHFSQALEAQARFPRALDARGNCYERLGNKEKAQADFKESHKIRQEDAEKQALQKQMVPPSGNGSKHTV